MPTFLLLRFCLCSLLIFTLIFDTSAQRAGRRRVAAVDTTRIEEKPSDQLELSPGWGRADVGTIGITIPDSVLKEIFRKTKWDTLVGFKINGVAQPKNTMQKDRVIRHVLKTIPGELFSRGDLVQAQRELANPMFLNSDTSAREVLKDDTKEKNRRDCRETNGINKTDVADSYPYLTEDGLRLYFTSNREKGHGRFFISTRKSINDPFVEPKVLSKNLTDGYYAGTLTADELTLCMVKSGEMYMSIRTDKNGEFPSPIKVKGTSDDYHFGPSISQDGKEIIVTVKIKGKDMIRVYERTDMYTVKVKTSFDVPEGSDPGPGQLSKDGLSYYFSLKKNGNEHLWRYTRKSINHDIFTNLEELPEQIKGAKNILQPSLNGDGSVMMFVTSPGNLWDEDDIMLVNHFKNDFVYPKIADSIIKNAGNTVTAINKISSPPSIEYSTILKEDLNTVKQSKRLKAIDQSLVQLKIYPNPFTAVISIELKEVPGHGVLFNLYDQSGKIIRQEKINNTRTNLSLNKLSAGVYTYQVVDEKGKLISAGRLVKAK